MASVFLSFCLLFPEGKVSPVLSESQSVFTDFSGPLTFRLDPILGPGALSWVTFGWAGSLHFGSSSL